MNFAVLTRGFFKILHTNFMVGRLELEEDELKLLRNFVKKGRKSARELANQSTHSAVGKPAKRGHRASRTSRNWEDYRLENQGKILRRGPSKRSDR
jgi:hypothetical protein